jgi:hypothetical protein
MKIKQDIEEDSERVARREKGQIGVPIIIIWLDLWSKHIKCRLWTEMVGTSRTAGRTFQCGRNAQNRDPHEARIAFRRNCWIETTVCVMS